MTLPLDVWLQERLENAERIAKTKNGADRAGWLEDAGYFRRAVAAVRAIDDARHYAAVCPVPDELTGPARIEMLERRARIGGYEQRTKD